MRKSLIFLALAATAALALAGVAFQHAAGGARNHAASVVLVPQAIEAPDSAFTAGLPASGLAACVTPSPVRVSAFIHCYTPQQIRTAYGVDQVPNKGAGQTIVLVDAYGSPTAAHDLQVFHDTFFSGLPEPNFDEVFPLGAPDFQNIAKGNGLSGPSAAVGWAFESTLDIEWAYAIAPLAHVVLLATPPAETLGVQGFPNFFKAIQFAIDKYPAGTVFSQSFASTEQDFGGAGAVQTALFDQVYQAAAAKGDTALSGSGDFGSTGVAKQERESRTFPFPTVWWPTSSPFVTSVGGTQLQFGWTWNPTSDTPFNPDGSFNPAYFAFTPGGNTEAVWNESWLPAATGGGKSVIYPRPSYQDGVASIIGSDARGVPDLSWNAAVNGGVLVYTSFFPNAVRVGWHTVGGTSASTPQVAAVVALANEQQAASGEPPLGALNPLLYKVGNGPAFRDIVPVKQGTAVSGELKNNQLFVFNADGSVSPGPVAGLPTLVGWDLTTGFGSPRVPAFVAAVRAARNT
jgi:subtilase family serine protease